MTRVDPDKLLIGVAAHVSRFDMAHALAKQVGAQVLNVDEGNHDVYEDRLAACAANHLAVLQQLGDLVIDHPWCIILEDDALPVEDFRKHAAAALTHAHCLVNFYIGMARGDRNRDRLEGAVADGIAWFTSRDMNSAVAYAIRSDVLPSILNRFTSYGRDKTVEWRLTAWAAEQGGSEYHEPRFYCTLPSLVDHADEKSIVFPGVNNAERRAWKVGIPDSWDTPAITHLL